MNSPTYSPSDDTMDAPGRSESQMSDEEDPDEDVSQDDTVAAALSTSTSAMAAAAQAHSVVTAVSSLASLSTLYREIGNTAVCWQLSSAKPGNGVEQLRLPNNSTFWQSDGVSQPHWIQLSFRRRLPVSHVALYLDYALDESYTPKAVRVETGMSSQDCTLAESKEFHEPVGWCIIPIVPAEPTHLVRVSVLSMHQNGRDTHVRRLAVFCARDNSSNNQQHNDGDNDNTDPVEGHSLVHSKENILPTSTFNNSVFNMTVR